MNSAAVRARMTHRAMIQRDMALPENGGTVDALNQAGLPDWSTVISEDGVPCWLRTESGSVAVSASEFVTVERLEILLPLSAAVRKEDRVATVRDRQGTTILAGPMRIVAVLPHHTHQEAQLERVH